MYRAVRCILEQEERYLLAIHNNHLPDTVGKWGLLGGRVEAGEALIATARREIQEEIGLSIERWQEIGDFSFRGYLHKVYAALYQGPEYPVFDRTEILELAWFGIEDIQAMHQQDKLHTRFELAAIQRYRALRA